MKCVNGLMVVKVLLFWGKTCQACAWFIYQMVFPLSFPRRHGVIHVLSEEKKICRLASEGNKCLEEVKLPI